MAAINISVLSGCGARAAIAAGGEGRSEDSSQKCLFSPQDWRDRCLVLQRMWAVFQKPQPRRLPVQPHNQLCCPDGHFETRGGWCQARGFRGLWFSKTLIQSLSSEGDSQHCQQMDPMLQHVRTMLPLVWQRLPLGLLRGASYLVVHGIAGNAELSQAVLQSREQDKDYKHMVVVASLDTESI